ncbi:MAG: cell division protein FtsQ/DivIB [Eisenbergiella sp.]
MAQKRKQDYKLVTGGKAGKKGKKKKVSGGKGAFFSSERFAQPQKRGPSRRFWLGLAVAGVVCAVLLGALAFVQMQFHVENVSVEGNVHYTKEEIEVMVIKDRLSANSLYLSFKYRNKEIRNIPFIEKMSVRVDSPNSITIRVYEKTVAGYVEYMGRYMYFDREGIVVESSETRTSGVPQVTGIDFDHVVLYEPLPVEDTAIFSEVLSITQMLSKYDIVTDKIFFNSENEITLYFGNVRARLGKDDLEEKVMRLQQILPNLEGETGVLDMQNYSDDRKNVTFRRDD